MIEECVYWRLVTWCYENESLVPLDEQRQDNIARVRTEEERKAVRHVVQHYFERTPEGYRQHKVDEIIARFKQGEPARDAARQVMNERKAASRARNKEMKEALQAAGHTVKGTLPNEALLALCEQFGVPVQAHWRAVGLGQRWRGVTCNSRRDGDSAEAMSQTKSQRENPLMSQRSQEWSQGDIPMAVSKPVVTGESQRVSTESQEVTEVTEVTGVVTGLPVHAREEFNTNTQYQIPLAPFGRSLRARAREEGVGVSVLNSEPTNGHTVTRIGMAGMALKRGGIGDANLAHPKFLALLDAGVTDDELQLTAAECSARGKGFGYVLAVIDGRRRDAAAAGPVPPRQPTLLETWAPSIAARFADQHSPDEGGDEAAGLDAAGL